MMINKINLRKLLSYLMNPLQDFFRLRFGRFFSSLNILGQQRWVHPYFISKKFSIDDLVELEKLFKINLKA